MSGVVPLASADNDSSWSLAITVFCVTAAVIAVAMRVRSAGVARPLARDLGSM